MRCSVRRTKCAVRRTPTLDERKEIMSHMKMRISIIQLVVLGSLIALLVGCATYGYYYTCSWCGKNVTLLENGNSRQLATHKAAHRRGELSIRDEEGNDFCSLRCKNSYLASKDIKEQRIRIIHGE